ncbi:unnamed protein product [Acanthoscelides obtectus]|uniref:Uncharacterized protein n=1 Tax=Acanthoscelides obtectus TaxID=200917 RepID=A0A9P0MN67_ACAOB|nr:unnamed protein product [Acanthoscelides obtectus]CAK1643081.1 hypothetical protein AOBTE_LOCUS13411 [Acanthoscelides obtectus]
MSDVSKDSHPVLTHRRLLHLYYYSCCCKTSYVLDSLTHKLESERYCASAFKRNYFFELIAAISYNETVQLR